MHIQMEISAMEEEENTVNGPRICHEQPNMTNASLVGDAPLMPDSCSRPIRNQSPNE